MVAEQREDPSQDSHGSDIAVSSELFAPGAPGVELCYQTFGDPDDEPLLLVMGLGGPMTWWNAEFCQRLKEHGLLMLAISAQQVRAVTHLDVDEADTIRDGEILAEVAEQAPRGKVVAGQEVVY